jgi:hypothetical protein
VVCRTAQAPRCVSLGYGADDVQIEASFHAAIRIAKEQNSLSLATRSEDTFAEYRRQKPRALGGQGLRRPLC